MMTIKAIQFYFILMMVSKIIMKESTLVKAKHNSELNWNFKINSGPHKAMYYPQKKNSLQTDCCMRLSCCGNWTCVWDLNTVSSRFVTNYYCPTQYNSKPIKLGPMRSHTIGRFKGAHACILSNALAQLYSRLCHTYESN